MSRKVLYSSAPTMEKYSRVYTLPQMCKVYTLSTGYSKVIKVKYDNGKMQQSVLHVAFHITTNLYYKIWIETGACLS